MKFRLANIAHDDKMVCFYMYTRLTFATLKMCFNFLGPAVNHLFYKGQTESETLCHSGRPHTLPPMENSSNDGLTTLRADRAKISRIN